MTAVLKVRKPVRFGFLDFSDQARRRDCRPGEVELNRRLAPDVYLGVVDLRWNGQDIDHVVVMRRLPEERRLATMVRAGGDLDAPLRSVARQLAGFHAGARRSPVIDRSATPARLLSGWASHFEETEPFRVDCSTRASTTRSAPSAGATSTVATSSSGGGSGRAWSATVTVICRPRTSSVSMTVPVSSTPEFDDELRYGDVLADLGFLVMDLERLAGGGTHRCWSMPTRSARARPYRGPCSPTTAPAVPTSGPRWPVFPRRPGAGGSVPNRGRPAPPVPLLP